MSKYSNINTTAMINAIDLTLNEIKKNDFNSIKNDIISGSYLKSSAQKIVDDALTAIISSNSKVGSITKLKENLENLRKIADNIKKYQGLEKDIIQLNIKRTTVTNNLNTVLRSSKSDKSIIDRKKFAEKNIQNISGQISAKEKLMKNYEKEIDKLLNT